MTRTPKAKSEHKTAAGTPAAGPKNWIVMAGQPVDTVHGGGYEFFGPFTEQDAKDYRTQLVNGHEPGTFIALAIQLLKFKRGRPRRKI